MGRQQKSDGINDGFLTIWKNMWEICGDTKIKDTSKASSVDEEENHRKVQ